MTASRFLRAARLRLSPLSLVVGTAIAVAACGSSHHKSTTTTPKSTPTTFTSSVFASGVPITFKSPSGTASINQPDDITELGGHIFVGFQNNVGPQGEPTPKGSAGAGNRDSTVVEFSSSGARIGVWTLLGHVDGVTADTAHNQVVVTTNEDASPHLYVLTPGSSQAASYTIPALPSKGGLDAVSFWKGMMLISGSAPGTLGKAPPQASYPAVYVVTLNSSSHTASVRGLFGDEASATKANSGQSGTTKLALSDPDSNFVVPSYASRFAGQFMLTSQGDYRDIFVGDATGKQLSTVKLSQSIDDTQWASGPSGTLYVTDGSADLIYKITGPFTKGQEVVGVSPCDAGNAPASCPSPQFPNNYLGNVNPSTGAVSKFPLTTPIQPAGLLFVP